MGSDTFLQKVTRMLTRLLRWYDRRFPTEIERDPQEDLTFTLLNLIDPDPEKTQRLIVLGSWAEDISTAEFASRLSQPGVVWYEITQDEKLVGYVTISGYTIGHGAMLAVCFFDRRTRGRDDTFGQFLAGIAAELELRYVWSLVPIHTKTIAAFLARVGFSRDGLLRGWYGTGDDAIAAIALSITGGELREYYPGTGCP